MEFNQEIIPYNNQVSQDYADQLEPGFRFCPRDSELITFYLNAKIHSRKLPKFRLHEVNIYDHNPEELAERYRSSEDKWYFLTPRDRKYPKGNRPKRDVGKFGYWKSTQKKKPVKDAKTGQKVGHRASLAFYIKPKQKTEWLMHEYTTNEPNLPFGKNSNKLNEWVLCKMYKKEAKEEDTEEEEEEEIEEPNGATPLPKRRRKSKNHEITSEQVDIHEEEIEEPNGATPLPKRRRGEYQQPPLSDSHAQKKTPRRKAKNQTVNQSVDHNNGQIIGMMNASSPCPIPMQPMTTIDGSSLLQCNDQSQFTSNGFQISGVAMDSVSIEQPLEDGAYATPTACTGLQISNGVLNSSSFMEELDYGGYTTNLDENWYKDAPILQDMMQNDVNQSVDYNNGLMNTTPDPSLIQVSPPCYNDQNQFTSDASNGFQISNGALRSVSMEQLLDDGAYTKTTACNGLQISNGVLNSSSSMEQLDNDGYTTDLAQNSYQDFPTLQNVQNVWDQFMEDVDAAGDFYLPQPADGYDATISSPDEAEWNDECNRVLKSYMT